MYTCSTHMIINKRKKWAKVKRGYTRRVHRVSNTQTHRDRIAEVPTRRNGGCLRRWPPERLLSRTRPELLYGHPVFCPHLLFIYRHAHVYNSYVILCTVNCFTSDLIRSRSAAMIIIQLVKQYLWIVLRDRHIFCDPTNISLSWFKTFNIRICM